MDKNAINFWKFIRNTNMVTSVEQDRLSRVLDQLCLEVSGLREEVARLNQIIEEGASQGVPWRPRETQFGSIREALLDMLQHYEHFTTEQAVAEIQTRFPCKSVSANAALTKAQKDGLIRRSGASFWSRLLVKDKVA